MYKSLRYFHVLPVIIVMVLLLADIFFIWSSLQKDDEVLAVAPIDYEIRPEFQAEYNKVYREVLTRNPEIIPISRVVSDDKNGLFQLLELCERLVDQRDNQEGHGLNFPEDFNDLLSDSDKWDRETYEKHRDDYASLIDELVIIGFMPERSSASFSITRLKFVDAALIRQCAMLLCADARWAAELGDSAKALIRLQAARGLASHMQDLEFSSVIMQTIALVMDRLVSETLVNDVIPVLDLESKEILRWKSLLFEDRGTSSERMDSIIRGECVIGLRNYVIPSIIYDPSYESIIPHEFYDVLVQSYLDMISKIEGLNDEALYLISSNGRLKFTAPATLHEDAGSLLSLMRIGWSHYIQGLVKSAVKEAFYHAALSVMAGEEIPMEPITGKSYRLDQRTNTLSLPQENLFDEFEIAPIKLP